MRIHSLTFILSYIIRYILLNASLIIFTGLTRKKNELYKRTLPSCKTRGIFKTKFILHFCDPIIAPDGKVCSMKCMYFIILYRFLSDLKFLQVYAKFNCNIKSNGFQFLNVMVLNL